eukprot:953628-Amphidinium_carterae.1
MSGSCNGYLGSHLWGGLSEENGLEQILERFGKDAFLALARAMPGLIHQRCALRSGAKRAAWPSLLSRAAEVSRIDNNHLM